MYMPIENVDSLTATQGFATLKQALDYLPPTASIIPSLDGAGHETQTVSFQITNAAEGTQIRFKTNLCDWRGNTRSGASLTLTLRFEATENPMYPGDMTHAIFKPYFEVSRGWSAIPDTN